MTQRELTFGPARYFRPVSSKGPFGWTFHGPMGYEEISEEISEEEAVKVSAICDICLEPLGVYEERTDGMGGLKIKIAPCAHCLAVERELGQCEKD